MREILLKTQRDLERITRWLGLAHDFAGHFTSTKYKGYKTHMHYSGMYKAGRPFMKMIFEDKNPF